MESKQGTRGIWEKESTHFVRRVLSMALALLLAMSLIPAVGMSAFADEADSVESEVVEQELEASDEDSIEQELEASDEDSIEPELEAVEEELDEFSASESDPSNTEDTIVPLAGETFPVSFTGTGQSFSLRNGLSIQAVGEIIYYYTNGYKMTARIPFKITGTAQQKAIQQVALDVSAFGGVVSLSEYDKGTNFGVVEGPVNGTTLWGYVDVYLNPQGSQQVQVNLANLKWVDKSLQPAVLYKVNSTRVRNTASGADHCLASIDAYYQGYVPTVAASSKPINLPDDSTYSYNLVAQGYSGNYFLTFGRLPLSQTTPLPSGRANYILEANGVVLNAATPIKSYQDQNNKFTVSSISSSAFSSIVPVNGVIELKLNSTVSFSPVTVSFTGIGQTITLPGGLKAVVQRPSTNDPVVQDWEGNVLVFFDLSISGTATSHGVWSYVPGTAAGTNTNLDFSGVYPYGFAVVPGSVQGTTTFALPLKSIENTVIDLSKLTLNNTQIETAGIHRVTFNSAALNGLTFTTTQDGGYGGGWPPLPLSELTLWGPLNYASGGNGNLVVRNGYEVTMITATYSGTPSATGTYKYQLTANGVPFGSQHEVQCTAGVAVSGRMSANYDRRITADTVLSVAVTGPQGSTPTYAFSAPTTPVTLTSTATTSNVTVTSTKNGVAQAWSVSSKPTWLNATRNGNTLALAVIGAPSQNQSGTVVLTQNESNRTLNISVTYTAQVANPVYVFNVSTSSVGLNSTTTSSKVTVTSTRAGASQAWSVTSKPTWLSATSSGNTLTLTMNSTPGQNQSGSVVLTQGGSNTTRTISVVYTAPVPPANGWFQDPVTKVWKYYENSVAVANVWRQVGGFWYFLDASGTMKTGPFKWTTGQGANNRYYILDANGRMQTSLWYKHTDGWRYHTATGESMEGWISLGGYWYYLNPSKAYLMQTTRYQVGPTWYTFDANGHMLTGWVNSGTAAAPKLRYYASSGAESSGWVQVAGYWYYLNPSNTNLMVASTRMTITGTTYGFDANGRMQAGWYNSGTTAAPIWRYYSPDAATLGKELSGWVQVGGYWFYLNPSNTNIMVKGNHVYAPFGAGSPLYSDFDANGRWLRYSAVQ